MQQCRMPLNKIQEALKDLLIWQRDAGADDAIEPMSVNWLSATPAAEVTVVRQPVSRKKTHTLPSVAPSANIPGKERHLTSSAVLTHTSIVSILKNAKFLASSAKTMDELQENLHLFDGCKLKNIAKNTCFADGNPNARIMFLGEAPGRDEDLQGKPFVGRAGQLLNKMMEAIGINRKDTFISNIVFWRPPGNRTPTPMEASLCRPFTNRQIELVNPEILVFLGGSSAKYMLNKTEGIMKLRNKWHSYDNNGSSIAAIATLHPAYLLRQPAQKRLAWQDFLKIKLALDKE